MPQRRREVHRWVMVARWGSLIQDGGIVMEEVSFGVYFSRKEHKLCKRACSAAGVRTHFPVCFVVSA